MNQLNKHVYDAIASEFSTTRSKLWEDLKPLVRYVTAGDRVLDLGCGNGRLSQLFHDLSISYVGLDQSEELIKLAQKKFSEVKFVVGEMTYLPFPDAYFDAIYCIAAFHHLTTRDTQTKALREMYRVMKAGGRLIMMNWNLESDWAKEKIATGKWKLGVEANTFIVPWKKSTGELLGDRVYYGFTFAELENLFTKASFTVEEQYYTNKGERSDIREGRNLVSIVKK